MKWIQGFRVHTASVVGLLALAGCPGENAEDTVRGTLLVEGERLKVEDVSKDGTTIAYSDADDSIFLISVNGGTPVEVASDIDDAEFKNDVLVLFSAVDNLAGTGTLQFVRPGQTTASNPIPDVNISSVEVSEDSQHIYYEVIEGVDPDFVGSAFLDEVEVVPETDPGEVRGRFTADNQFLIVSFNPAAAESAIIAVPLNGGANISIPGCDVGCSARFQVSNSGQQIVFGANENGDNADLTAISASGQGEVTLSAGASDNAFVIAKDSERLLFLDDALVLNQINLDGTGLSSLGVEGVVDIVEANSTAIVFASDINAISGLATLHIVNADGTQDTTISGVNTAKDEGFSPDNSFYLFMDNVIGGSGTLKFTSTQAFSVEEISGAVDKASFQNDTSVVFLNDSGLLQTVDLNTNQPAFYDDLIQESSQVVFTVPGGKSAGLYIDDL
jgi:hypothetical protein